MYVVREGYEGLVRGNTEAGEDEAHRINTATESAAIQDAQVEAQQFNVHPDFKLIHNLRFGDGPLLKDGTSEYVGGRTLKGRHIVRVGWDDVRGWFSEVFSRSLL
jgi:6-phosphofructokinase 1